MLAHPQAEYQCPYLGQVKQIHGGVGESISQHLLGPHAQTSLEVCETHRNISDYLGGVGTPMGRASVPKSWPGWDNTCRSGEVNISASIRAPCTKYFWNFLRHIGTFLDYWGGVGTPMDGALVPDNWAKLSKYIGEWGSQYLCIY